MLHFGALLFCCHLSRDVKTVIRDILHCCSLVKSSASCSRGPSVYRHSVVIRLLGGNSYRHMNQDRMVGILTILRRKSNKSWFNFRLEHHILPFCKSLASSLKATQPPTQWVPRFLLQG